MTRISIIATHVSRDNGIPMAIGSGIRPRTFRSGPMSPNPRTGTGFGGIMMATPIGHVRKRPILGSEWSKDGLFGLSQ
jgi:hypothetical protein